MTDPAMDEEHQAKNKEEDGKSSAPRVENREMQTSAAGKACEGKKTKLRHYREKRFIVQFC